MVISIPLRGRVVFLVWGLAAGAAALWATRGMGGLWQAAGWLILAGLPAWLFLWAGRFSALPGADGSLTVHTGLVWRQMRWVQPGATLFIATAAGPLLGLAGLRVAVVVTAGGVTVLPGISRADAALLQRLLGSQS